MSADFDVAEIIRNAKLGSTRRDAQIDTCTVFSAALHKVLSQEGIHSEVWCASYFLTGERPKWAHSVIKIGEDFYDSLGLFDLEIVRKRVKTHPSVQSHLDYQKDVPEYEDEFSEMYDFYVSALTKAIQKARRARSGPA